MRWRRAHGGLTALPYLPVMGWGGAPWTWRPFLAVDLRAVGLLR